MDEHETTADPSDELSDLAAHPDEPGRPRAVRRAVGIVTAVLLLSGVAAAVGVGSQPDEADAVLGDIAAFVGRASTVHVDGVQEWSSGDGGGGLGSTFTTRSRLSADLDLTSGAVHETIDDGTTTFESIVIGDVAYSRYADEGADLDEEQWEAASVEAEDGSTADELEAMLETEGADGLLGQGLIVQGGLAGSGSGLPELGELLAGLHDATRAEGGTIVVELPLAELLELMLPDVDPELFDDVAGDVRIELTAGPSGRLDRMRAVISADADGATTKSIDDLRFRAWGDDLAIAAPDASTVDPTPSFDEESMLTAGFVPLAPAVVPEPLRLLSATFYEAGSSDEGCSDVTLHYADPAEERAARDWRPGDPDVFPHSMELTMTAVSCTADDEYSEEDEGFEDGERSPITVGPFTGTLTRFDGFADRGASLGIELVIGDVRVAVSSDLSEDVTLSALASLAPLDLATQPVLELAGLGPS